MSCFEFEFYDLRFICNLEFEIWNLPDIMEKKVLLPEFCTYSCQQCKSVYICWFSEAKFAGKNSGIRYFFKLILLKTKITRMVKTMKSKGPKKL
jgi:hypothetical protein